MLVPNQFVQGDGSGEVLVVLLPGKGYSTAMPLLFYAENLGIDRGWDVLRVDYNYLRLDLTDDELVARLVADPLAAIETGLRRRGCKRVIVVGKSLATIAMTRLSDVLKDRKVRYIWLTPLLQVEQVFEAIESGGSESLVVIGGADSLFDSDLVSALDEAGVNTHVVDGADHGMDTPAGVVDSISVLGGIYGTVNGFLDGF
ncbi:MAG: hypothetical protein WKF81_01895 [Thermomicrobiales bacterium]